MRSVNGIQGMSMMPFKGKFYVTTDCHARLPMLAGVLTSITDKIKNDKEKSFYFDGGDFLGLSLPFDTTVDVYEKFKKDNPETPVVLNAGNADLDLFSILLDRNKNDRTVLEKINALTKKGIDVISLSMIDFLKRKQIKNESVKPYVILNDEHDGKKEKILVTGLTFFYAGSNFENSGQNLNSPEYLKELFKENILPLYQKEKPDKVILMLHYDEETSKKIVDFVKNDLGIKETKLVIGGHPHSINDFEYNDTRFLYAPAQGKGALQITNKKDEIIFSKLKPLENKYIYSPITQNPDIISNLDIAKPIQMDEGYKKIFEKPINKPYFKKLATSTVNLKYRNDYDFEYAEPTEVGTFVSNAYKNHISTKYPAIGLTLSMDLREKNPAAGAPITPYNIGDIINVEKKLVVFDDIDVSGLKKMLEMSLREQNEGNHAKNFIEYSDNIMVDRYINVPINSPKIKQIYFKQGDNFIPLLDKDANPLKELDDLKFSVITDTYTAAGSREGLTGFKDFKNSRTENITNRQVLVKEFQRFEQQGINHFEAAKIRNLIK